VGNDRTKGVCDASFGQDADVIEQALEFVDAVSALELRESAFTWISD